MVLIDATGIVPTVNQIELHPRLPQTELREVHAHLGIATEAWSPLGRGSLLTHPTITAVAEDCGRTPAQVLIRWHIQLGNIVIPKSVNPITDCEQLRRVRLRTQRHCNGVDLVAGRRNPAWA